MEAAGVQCSGAAVGKQAMDFKRALFYELSPHPSSSPPPALLLPSSLLHLSQSISYREMERVYRMDIVILSLSLM